MGSGFRTFASGEVLTAANVNNYLMEQTVMSFADTTARDAAVTSPEEGMTAYLQDTNSVTVYSGSAWVTIADLEVLIVDSTNARVGIGTQTPSSVLHVKGAVADDATAELVVEGDGTMAMHGSLSAGSYNNLVQAGDKAIIFTDGTVDTGNFVIAPWSNGSEGVRITSGGEVGIGTSPSYNLDVNGAEDTASRININSANTANRYAMRFSRNNSLFSSGIYCDTSQVYFGTPSDANLKTDIEQIPTPDALATVNQLKPVTYRFLTDPENVVRRGFIAQEVEEVLPEAVHRVGQDDDIVLTWEPITTTAVAAVQELFSLVNELTARIELLENR